MKILSLAVFLLLVLSSCDKEMEKECIQTCGPLQFCENGVCRCSDDQFLLGNTCEDRCADCFEGSFECGCDHKYIFDVSQFNWFQYKIANSGSGSSGTTKISETMFKTLIVRSCDIGDKKSTHIEFIIDTSDSTKLDVNARYYVLPNETFATCSSVFTK